MRFFINLNPYLKPLYIKITSFYVKNFILNFRNYNIYSKLSFTVNIIKKLSYFLVIYCGYIDFILEILHYVFKYSLYTY